MQWVEAKKKKKKEDSGDRLVGKPKDKIFF